MEAIEKIDEEITKLYDINDKLIDIIAVAGRDSETHYTKDYWTIVDGAEALRKALQRVLDTQHDVVADLDEWLSSLPVKPQKNPIAEHMLEEALGAAKRTEKALNLADEVGL